MLGIECNNNSIGICCCSTWIVVVSVGWLVRPSVRASALAPARIIIPTDIRNGMKFPVCKNSSFVSIGMSVALCVCVWAGVCVYVRYIIKSIIFSKTDYNSTKTQMLKTLFSLLPLLVTTFLALCDSNWYWCLLFLFLFRYVHTYTHIFIHSMSLFHGWNPTQWTIVLYTCCYCCCFVPIALELLPNGKSCCTREV